MNKIDHIYYINLEHRKDRKDEFLLEMSKLEVPNARFQRIAAEYIQGRGHLGCTASHIKTIETFLASSFQNCLICEDDFSVCNPESFWKVVNDTLQKLPDFDVFMISHNIQDAVKTDYEEVKKLKKSYTSCSYILTRQFAPRLLENLKEGFVFAVKEESETMMKTHNYCLDVHWSKLMEESNWYAIVPALAKQRPSFSDIEKGYVNHGV
jgi:GR25 family glycosyltransferase involved in LPS biosynthesis